MREGAETRGAKGRLGEWARWRWGVLGGSSGEAEVGLRREPRVGEREGTIGSKVN